jgi:hypothetical protein
MSVLEVNIRDEKNDEHIYWVSLESKPESEDEIDWAISRALKYHAEHVGTKPAEESEDDLPVTAYEPFDRNSDEYTFVK